jgi:hypothetical protein
MASLCAVGRGKHAWALTEEGLRLARSGT